MSVTNLKKMINFEEKSFRDYNKKFNWPTKIPRSLRDTDITLDEVQEKFVRKLIEPFRYVFLIGLSCTGKSTFLSKCTPRPNWTLTKWDRDNIWSMIFQDNRRVDKYYNYMDQFEEKLFSRLFDREKHQIVVEGWMSTKGKRTRYASFMPKNLGRIGVFVFDGPTEEIVERAKSKDVLDLPEDEVGLFLKSKKEDFEWPSHDEGFHSIYYINTFGQTGARYFREVLD